MIEIQNIGQSLNLLKFIRDYCEKKLKWKELV